MNGMCHLEGGGGGAGNNTNWHMNLLTPEKAPLSSTAAVANVTNPAGYLSDMKPQPPPSKQPALDFNHHQQQSNGAEAHHPHQTAAATAVVAAAAQSLLETSQQQQQQQHLSSIAHPVLPPSLRESVSYSLPLGLL